MTSSLHVDRPEFSRPIAVAHVSEGGEAFRFAANTEERAALARRFDLLDLPSLEVDGEITVFDHGRRARVEGIVRARVVQSCVVTLEPVAAGIEEPFTRTYSALPPKQAGTETEINLDEDEPPEPIVGGAIDVGEAAAETLGLSLDPYPRALGAAVGLAGPAEAGHEEVKEGPELAETKRESPFSALKGLLKKP